MKATIRLCWAATLFALCVPAFATTFCVHNFDEFASAMVSAEEGGDASAIELVQGSYLLDALSTYSLPMDFTISGGWNSTCSDSSVNPLNTVIEGGNTYFMFFDAMANLTVDGIHFSNIPIEGFSGSNITVRHSIFTGQQGTDAVQVQSASGVVLLDSNVFDGKNLEIIDQDGTDANVTTWHVINNTIINAVRGMSDEINRNGYGLTLNDAGEGFNLHIVLANNALWNNATGGVRVNSFPEVFATHNSWQTFEDANNTGLAAGSIDNTTVDPQIDASYHPITPNSSSINSGTITVPGGLGATDAGGGPRVIGTAPDRGAYESPVNDETTLTVTNNADAGSGSLRQALADAASSPNAQTIVFNLPSCPTTINVNSALSAIVDTLTIDGFTQTGASANTLAAGDNARLCVILNGNYASSEGLIANAVGSHATVRGLAFENFGFAAIDFTDGDSHVIEGNQFGGSLANGRNRPIALAANARAIRLAEDSADSFVGGIDPQQRNIIDGSTVYGVALADNLGGHEMRNNYVGIGANGSSAAGNNVGIIVSSNNNIVDRNVIGDSAAEGVRLQGNPTSQGYAQGNILIGNVIGLPAVQGNDSVQNFGAGVRITANAIGNQIGVDANGQIAGNLIVNNGLYGSNQDSDGYGGISVESGTKNRISGNIIYANFGLAIDLGNDGPTPNDATDSDTGANNLQNFPDLVAIRHDNGGRQIRGSIYLATNTKIEVFAAPTCHDTGRVDAYAALSTNASPLIAPNGGGTVTFGLDIGRGPGTGVDPYCKLGATATDANGNTSEMSMCFVDDTIFAHGFEDGPGFSCAP